MFVVFGTRGLPHAIDRGTRHTREHALFEPIPQRCETRPARPRASSRARRAATPRPDKGRNVFRARAPVPLVLAAGHVRRQARAALDPQCAGTLRTIELVGGKREEIDAQRPNIDRNLRDRLHGVGVEQRAARVRQPRQLRIG